MADHADNADHPQGAGAQHWIEVYHSKHSWTETQITYSADGAAWVPYGRYKLIDAADVRPGFRAFRIQASTLELRLCDAAGRHHDPKDVADKPHAASKPGRYVIEGDSIRRVGPADATVCLRALNPAARWLELYYRAPPAWRRAYVAYFEPKKKRFVAEPMRVAACDGLWFHRIEMPRAATFAFMDGADRWDDNRGSRYSTEVPGKYAVIDARLVYLGDASADVYHQS